MRPSKPWLQDEEKQILKSRGDWTDPAEEEAITNNKIKSRLGSNAPFDPYERVQAESLDGVYHDSQGGYLRAPKSGGSPYINVPVQGGFAPILPIIASALLPVLFGKLFGSGTLSTTKPINMSNAHSFFNSLADDISHQTHRDYANKKMEKLFGSGWKKYSKSRYGGSVVDELKMGHLLMPLLRGHIRKALGRGIDPEPLLEKIEQMNAKEFDRLVTPDVLIHGGSILGSLWSGLKGIFGKVFNSGLASKVGKSALSAAEKVAPSLAESGINKLAEYATKKISGQEPEISEEKLESNKNKRISQLKRDAELRKLERQMEKEEENDYEEEPPRRTNRSKYIDEEVPSGVSDSKLRKELANKRRTTNKALVPQETEQKLYKIGETGWHPMMKVKVEGRPIGKEDLYGWGRSFGKKKDGRMPTGGAWKVQLTRT